MKLGRNDPCHCGSGNKYKKCCLAKDETAVSAQMAAEAAKRQADAERARKDADEKESEDAPVAKDPGRAGAAPKFNRAKPARTAESSTAQPLRRRRASV
jgi:hypothetical protein